MLARPQEFEHPLRVLSVNRLPKDQPIDTNDRIGRDYHGIRVNKPGGLGLGAGQASRDNLRISVRGHAFVYLNRPDFERQFQAD